MATLRQYFETDFSHVARIYVKIVGPDGEEIETQWLVDFLGYMSFLSCYIPGQARSVEFFKQLVRGLQYGTTRLVFQHKIVLPSGRLFPGVLTIANESSLNVTAKFFGDPGEVSANAVQMSKRLFIYSETQLAEQDIIGLKEEGTKAGHEVQFRSEAYASALTAQEGTLAFVSYDSRDRDVAQNIAIGLQRLMCPVWYDQFSLKVGDNLRDSIEKGLSECKKCILVLSSNFFSNRGWTKREFDSVFTREILEERHLVLPVWYGVNKQQVYTYSPSLLNVKGIDWQMGEEEVCRQLYRAIEP